MHPAITPPVYSMAITIGLDRCHCANPSIKVQYPMFLLEVSILIKFLAFCHYEKAEMFSNEIPSNSYWISHRFFVLFQPKIAKIKPQFHLTMRTYRHRYNMKILHSYPVSMYWKFVSMKPKLQSNHVLFDWACACQMHAHTMTLNEWLY